MSSLKAFSFVLLALSASAAWANGVEKASFDKSGARTAAIALPADATNVRIAEATLGWGPSGRYRKYESFPCSIEGTPGCGTRYKTLMQKSLVTITVSFDSGSFDPIRDVQACAIGSDSGAYIPGCERTGHYTASVELDIGPEAAARIGNGKAELRSRVQLGARTRQVRTTAYSAAPIPENCAWNNEYGGYEGPNCRMIDDRSAEKVVRKPFLQQEVLILVGSL